MRISMFLWPTLSGSSLMTPLSASSVGTRMSSTIFCILLFGFSGVARKSSKDEVVVFEIELYKIPQPLTPS